MAGVGSGQGHPAHRRKVTSCLGKVFELNPGGLNWPRAVLTLDVMLVPPVLFWVIGHEQYLPSALFAEVSDPGGSYGQRALRIFVFGAIGAGLTALGFGIGGEAWGWLVLAAFAVTLISGLAVMFGVHRFVAAFVLNIRFIITLAWAFGFHHQTHTHITQYTCAQVVAWAGGTVLWIGAQRVAGALIGGVAAGLLLLIPANVHGLRLFAVDRGHEVVELVLLIHGEWLLELRALLRGPSPRRC